ncbi:MAG TPA: amidohydrolase [Thermomicrobiales bacterium]|jgi:amidohydrolase|nr:amidohydrolase [Thermomicrobiales bacterium]
MTTTAPDLQIAVDEILPGVVADRRHLHEHPELGMQEVETSKFVAARLAQLGVEDIRTGIANYGVTGLIRGTGSGPNADRVLMLRADMDALPIEEENDVEYRSQTPGIMHACGHDGHTAMLMGTARILMGMRDQFAGTVKVLFQPAEEGPGGAEPMIAEGALEDPHVDASFGLHLAQEMPLGVVASKAGPSMAAADSFSVTIQGRGGHGARPHGCVDPIMVGAQIITALQTLVSREIDPLKAAVVTVGALHAGKAGNVIPDTAEMRGTVRSFDPDVRDHLERRVPEVIKGIAAALQAEATVEYELGPPAVTSDVRMAQIVRDAAAAVVGVDNAIEQTPIMGAEDMSYFLNAVPGCYFHVGSRNEAKGFVWGHHHPKFDIDEDALGVGIQVTVEAVLRYFADPEAPKA